MEKYIEYNFTIIPKEIGSEILVAELGEVGFESFVETEQGVLAYIQEKQWNKELLNDIQILNSSEFDISYQITQIEQVNWNQEWEKNFNPIIIDDICTIRATFHPKPNTLYDIIIDPKMSFGTGHHETTYQMLKYLLSMDLQNKKVLDMGCGTGILAIMTAHRGAHDIDAIDVDPWCYENSKENIALNDLHHINILLGDATLLQGKKYDLIIANINRNILLADIATYSKSMNPNAQMLLSGFYTEDLPSITQKCQENGLTLVDYTHNNNWVAARYTLS